MLTILRVRGAGCRNITDLPGGGVFALRPSRLYLFQVDLHCTQGDNERCNNMEVTTRCSPVSHHIIFIVSLSSCCWHCSRCSPPAGKAPLQRAVRSRGQLPRLSGTTTARR